MGLFSIFRSKDPEKVASELVAAALDLEVSPEEWHWAKKVGVEQHRFIAERNALRVGMTEAGVALALGTTRHITSPGYKLEKALSEQFRRYFAAMPNVEPAQGQAYYSSVSSRYILREPAEMAGIFHFYLLNPGAWADRETQSTPPYSLPEGFQAFVHAIMKPALKNSLIRTKELGE